MQTNVNVIVKEDDSVTEKIKKTAVALDKKYSKKRKVNEKWLMKGRSKTARVFSVIIDVILVSMCVFCCMLGASSFIFKMNNLPPTFAGFSCMEVSSPSMVAAGFEIGDAIIVRKVDPKTLDVGEHIAFYKYSKDFNQFDNLQVEEITSTKHDTANNYGLSIGEFVGIPSQPIVRAAKAGAERVFHTIVRVYEDENGMLWFKTKGASNNAADTWEVSERMVIGVLDDSPMAGVMTWLLEALTSNTIVLVIIAVPLVLMSLSFVAKMIRKVQLTRLELDCVEEKRKITDPICVKNNIGFNLSKEDKYKILVQAPESQREEYMGLLWKDGSAPSSIHKYIIRKRFVLKENQQMLELNRYCEKLHADGVEGETIAKIYLNGKEKIEAEQQRYKRIFKNIRKTAQEKKEVAIATPVATPVEAAAATTSSVVESAQPVEANVAQMAPIQEKTVEIPAIEVKEEVKDGVKSVAKKPTTAKSTKASATKTAAAKATSTKKTSTSKAAKTAPLAEAKPAAKTVAKTVKPVATKADVPAKPAATKKVEKKPAATKTPAQKASATKATEVKTTAKSTAVKASAKAKAPVKKTATTKEITAKKTTKSSAAKTTKTK